ncbi:MAG TPA: hypothetical protein VEC96_08005 [Anaerolineae bacterium]|nr:hypothetical protein [Anaerolineae bacterium]
MAKYVKPTLDTKFHIDFAWWKKQSQNLGAYLQSHLCSEAKAAYSNQTPNQTFDWVNPETGEVFQIDMLWYTIQTECGEQPNFIDENMPLTRAIFRLFIANDNIPLTPLEIHEKLRKKNPDLILRTIGGHQVYEGIRPVSQSI